MASYARFAEVYDALMTDIPYDEYVEWVKTCAPQSEYPTLLDIGCGTGVLAALFDEAGYQVSGVDVSEEMLMIASTRFAEANKSIPLIAMPMEQLEGFQELDVAIIPIDSINYVREEQAVIETLQRIYDSLRQGGQLFFDVHSLYKMDEVFLDSPFTYDDEEIAYVWHTEQGKEAHSVYHYMTFFAQTANGLYERFDEEHYQRTFAPQQYEAWLCAIGFNEVHLTADWSVEAPKKNSERIFIRAVK
ncbi:class I SAM-dependent methyltransferase [Metasolibacillus meyeri]|uniref:Class I SAM-dependent methyltransferase n=1 Tax=Metasolibacillus meyeri TaxID=1071052 RepID=A0AAW9NVF1_9BACL|nr:class I SAM-dependent methyltransferase [Metasolibacillus meyeri]MEC1179864.1 class I SAM-dependent methyltransferase [Metasolibacillus meyeri]